MNKNPKNMSGGRGYTGSGREKENRNRKDCGQVPDRADDSGLSRVEFIKGAAGLAAGVVFLGASGSVNPNRNTFTPPKGRRKLIKGGRVITMDPEKRVFEKADLLIEGTEIKTIGTDLDVEADDLIDASGMIVMPGFVDTHRHMWQGALRNLMPNSLLDDYLEYILRTARPVYRPEDVYIGNLVSSLGAIHAGVTTVLDWSHIGNSPAHSDAALEALMDSGIRGVYAYGGGAAGPENKFPDDLGRLKSKYFSNGDSLLSLALAAGIDHEQWTIARDLGVRISVHVNGTGQLLPMADVLGPDVTCIHCPNLMDEEWELLAETGVGVSISSPAEMVMGHGIPPVQQALDHGIRPSLSVDVESTVSGDMFAQMQSVFTLQRMQVLDRRRSGETDLPGLLNVRDVVEFATYQGAVDNGLETLTGSLETGKKADIVLLKADKINVMPLNDPYGAIVFGMDRSNVDSVIVNGRVLKWNGELVDTDLKQIYDLLLESREHIFSKAGRPGQGAG